MMRLLLAALAGLALAAPARAAAPPPPNTVFCTNVGTPTMSCFTDPNTPGGTAVLTTSPQFAAYLAAQGVAQQLASGVTVSSTKAPVINGTYSADRDAVQDMAIDLLYCLVNKTFPGGKTANITIFDTSGIGHVIPDCATMTSLASAVIGAYEQAHEQAITVPQPVPAP